MRRSARLTRRQISTEQEREVPLTQDELNLILSKLTANIEDEDEESKINILDPYCGDGHNLLSLSQSLDTNTCLYGIERNKDKRREAKRLLDKVVLGTYGDLRVTNGVFSLVVLHPPIGGKNPVGMPRESIVFGDLSLPGKYLYPGSIMVTIIHQKVIKNIAQLLSIRFTDIEVGKISEDRVVIFGVRSKGRVENELAREQREYLFELAQEPDLIPELSDKVYEIPPTQDDVITFRGYILDDEELAEDTADSSLWERVAEALTPESRLVEAPKPLLPLSDTHVAVAAAAGVINGRTGDHYRKGVTKEVSETISLEEDNTVTTIQTKRHVSRVRIFSKDGVFDLEH